MTQIKPQYLTMAQTAALSGFSIHTLYEWAAAKRIAKPQGVFKCRRRWKVAWDTFRVKVIESGDF